MTQPSATSYRVKTPGGLDDVHVTENFLNHALSAKLDSSETQTTATEASIPTPDAVDDVLLNYNFIHHVLSKYSSHEDRKRFVNYTCYALRQPAEVWRTWVQRYGGWQFSRDIYAARFANPDTFAVVQTAPELGVMAWVFSKSGDRLNQYREGELVYCLNET